MKVLITTDIPLSFVCGSTYFIKRLSALLIARGHEVAVLCPGGSIWRESSISPEGIRIYGVPSVHTIVQDIRLPAPLIINRAIRSAFDAFKPDVVHVQTHFQLSHQAIRVARVRGIPVVGTNHFIPENVFHHFRLPSFAETWLQRFGWKHFHMVFTKLHAVTTPTATAAGFMQRSGFPLAVTPISNGVDRQRFCPGTPDPTIRERYGLPQKPLLLYVGRLDPEKNVDWVLHALPALIARTDVHFVVVGRGSKEASLKELVRALHLEGQTTFLGYVPDADLPSLYRLADCFIMPGTAELQSIATMEAMASGLPIIAADALALPELVHHGVNGFLFDPAKSPELVDQVAGVFLDPELRMRMGKKSLEMVAHHDINNTVEQFEDIYQRAVQ